jgi:integrase
MGVNVSGCRPRQARPLKWWLRPDDHKKLVAWLRVTSDPANVTARELETIGRFVFVITTGLTPPPLEGAELLADYIDWTVQTGLRVEESLRLRRSDFAADYRSVTVPGTKTGSSQATLPITGEATAVVSRRFSAGSQPVAPGTLLFPATYTALRIAWREARRHIGADGNPMATLKALRRSAARRLHADLGMPLDKVRHYLRHSSVSTTMGYLRARQEIAESVL